MHRLSEGALVLWAIVPFWFAHEFIKAGRYEEAFWLVVVPASFVVAILSVFTLIQMDEMSNE